MFVETGRLTETLVTLTLMCLLRLEDWLKLLLHSPSCVYWGLEDWLKLLLHSPSCVCSDWKTDWSSCYTHPRVFVETGRLTEALVTLTLMCLLRLEDWLKLLLHTIHLCGRCFSCTCKIWILSRSRFSNDLKSKETLSYFSIFILFYVYCQRWYKYKNFNVNVSFLYKNV